jgi:hypothetical protein
MIYQADRALQWTQQGTARRSIAMVFWPSYHPQKIILQSHKERRMETTAEYVEEKG